MADTVLDALVITLGLDPSGLEAGRKKAASEILKLRDDAKKVGDEQETRTRRTLDGLGKIRTEVLGLAVAFTGARGISDFVGNIIAGDAATGRLARNLGIATQQLSAWQYAVRSVNGSSADASASLSRVFGIAEEHKFQGVSSADPVLTRLGVRQEELGDANATLLALSENRSHDTFSDRSYLLSQLGLDGNTINVLTQGRKAVEALLNEGKRLGATTDADAKAAEQAQKRWNDFTTAVAGKARPVIEDLVGKLLDLTENTGAASTAVPILTVAVGTLAAPFIVAYGPIMAIGAAIAYVLEQTGGLNRALPDLQADLSVFTGRISLAMQEWDALRHGDFRRLTQLTHQDLANTVGARIGDSDPQNLTGGAAAAAGGKASGLEALLMARGLSAAQAKGVAAGIYAESGGDPNAVNPTSGAYGIAQWLGARKAKLFAMYGPNPTLEQQVQFMTWEMKHGERRAAGRIGMATDARTAGLAFLAEYERPGAGLVGDVSRMDAHLGLRGARGRVQPSRSASAPASTNETHIGSITVHTQATDAKGIAATLPPAIKKRSLTAQANSGL